MSAAAEALVGPTPDAAHHEQSRSTTRTARPAGRLTSADVVVALVCAVVGGVRWWVLAQSGEPSGFDFGNWLTFGHLWLGDGVPGGSSSTYPPVVPLLAVAATHLLGAPAADWLLASACGLAPGVGIYLVLRAAQRRWAGAVLAIPVVAGSAAGEAVAWGGLPQLLGLGLAPVLLWNTARLLQTRGARRGWSTGGLLLLLGATSHLVLAQTVLALALLVLMAAGVAVADNSLRSHRDLPLWGRRGWVASALRAGTPSLLLVPLYLHLFTTVGQSFVASQQTAQDVLAAAELVFREALLPWRVALVVAAIAPFVAWRSHRSPLWRCAVALLCAEVLLVALRPELRLAYLLPTCAALSLALVLPAPSASSPRAGMRSPAVLVCALVAALACYSGVTALRIFPAQQDFYGTQLMPKGTMTGLTWLRDHSAADAVVAVAPVRGCPFGWWVEGYSRRNALVGSSMELLNFPRERSRAVQAVRFFDDPELLGQANLEAVRAEGVDYLVVPRGWRGLDRAELKAQVASAPSAVAFSNAAMTIVRVPPAAGDRG